MPRILRGLQESGEAQKVVFQNSPEKRFKSSPLFRIKEKISTGKEIQISLLRRLGSELRPLTLSDKSQTEGSVSESRAP
jgi:hypothetical protein